MLALLLTTAIVVEDQAAMRAAPHDAAALQALLHKGEWLEVRGESGGFLKVYDHRRERPGYLRREAARSYVLDEKSAPELHAVIDFLRDSPGAESLGIGYVALYVKAERGPVKSDVFDALGTMAERLARRASVSPVPPLPSVAQATAVTIGAGGGVPNRAAAEKRSAAQLEVAESYGVRFRSYERGEATLLCYDGEAFRKVLALGGSGPERARAALALTRPECADDALGPLEKKSRDEERSRLLDEVASSLVWSVVSRWLPHWLIDRVHLRRVEVAAELSFSRGRAGDEAGAAAASLLAESELALCDTDELLDEDRGLRDEAVVRAAAARWAGRAMAAGAAATTKGTAKVAGSRSAHGRLSVAARQGQPGQTCVTVEEHAARSGDEAPRAVAERCTYGLVYPGSASVSPTGNALVMVAQPLPGWTELWLFRRDGGDEKIEKAAWVGETITPAASEPDLGVASPAGWTRAGALRVERSVFVRRPYPHLNHSVREFPSPAPVPTRVAHAETARR